MLTVIIDARQGANGLTTLLAQLTAGVVEGLVRQVAIVAAADPALEAVCEDTGADLHPTLEAAASVARAQDLLVLPADFRLRDGWIGALTAHLAHRSAREAVVAGLSDGGFFAARPFGVLVERGRLDGRRGADLKRLRRELGLRARRVG